MLKVKKIQKETKRQNKKIWDQANYVKGRVETMTNERTETNESVHKLERQQICRQRQIEDTIQYWYPKMYITTAKPGLTMQIIQTVSENIFKVDIPKSPCRTTIQNIIDEGHYLSRKQVGSALREAENWDLLADCTSRDGRKILDAGVHLSDKRTMSLGFTNITIIFKMLSTLSCVLSDRSSVM